MAMLKKQRVDINELMTIPFYGQLKMYPHFDQGTSCHPKNEHSQATKTKVSKVVPSGELT